MIYEPALNDKTYIELDAVQKEPLNVLWINDGSNANYSLFTYIDLTQLLSRQQTLYLDRTARPPDATPAVLLITCQMSSIGLSHIIGYLIADIFLNSFFLFICLFG